MKKIFYIFLFTPILLIAQVTIIDFYGSEKLLEGNTSFNNEFNLNDDMINLGTNDLLILKQDSDVSFVPREWLFMKKEIITNNNYKELFVSWMKYGATSGYITSQIYEFDGDKYVFVDEVETKGERMFGEYPIECNVGLKYFYSSGATYHHYPFDGVQRHYEIIDGRFQIIGYGDKELLEIQLIDYLSMNNIIELGSDKFDNGERKAIANYLIQYYSLPNVKLKDVELLFYKSINDISDKHNLWKEIKAEILSIYE